LVVLTLLAGMAAGPALAFLLDRRDHLVRHSEALGRAAGVPLLADVNGQGLTESLSLAGAHLLARHPEAKVVLVTPAGTWDSAREVAKLLASAGQQSGKKVQLVHLAGLTGGWRQPKGRSNGVHHRSAHHAGSPAFAEEYDLVVVSAPAPDRDPAAASIAADVDVAVLVGTAGYTRASEARRVAETLREVGVTVAAGVLVSKSTEPPRRRSFGRSKNE
jgi:hypothetical protein